MKYAWGDKYPEWDKHLTKITKEALLPAGLKVINKNLTAHENLAQLISIMAKYESGFDPKQTYKENFKDSKGKYIISRGLLQLSIESVNGYGLKIKSAQDLHDPLVNLTCAVKILTHWANKDGVLMGEPKKGGARYWSVCRKSSKSNAPIIKYMESLV